MRKSGGILQFIGSFGGPGMGRAAAGAISPGVLPGTFWATMSSLPDV
jgi:hypothetical protein